MLVLSRKVGESIVVETPLGNVEVKVVSVNGGNVKIGLDADKRIPITRDDAKVKTPGTADWLDRIGESLQACRERGAT